MDVLRMVYWLKEFNEQWSNQYNAEAITKLFEGAIKKPWEVMKDMI